MICSRPVNRDAFTRWANMWRSGSFPNDDAAYYDQVYGVAGESPHKRQHLENIQRLKRGERIYGNPYRRTAGYESYAGSPDLRSPIERDEH